MAAGTIGVRCQGEKNIRYAIWDGGNISAGQSVVVTQDGVSRRGTVVILPGELLEYYPSPPVAHAEIDASDPSSPSADSAGLWSSLNIPEELWRRDAN